MRSIGDAIWSVEVTATTVVSGDCVSVNAGGELAAVASMVVGVVSVSVVSATLAANFLAAENGQPTQLGTTNEDIAVADRGDGDPASSAAIDLVAVVRRLDHFSSSVDALTRKIVVESGNAVE